MTNVDDVAELRQEIERLRAELASERERPAVVRRSAGAWVQVVSYGLLLVLVAVLAPVAVVARWVDKEVSSTDRFVSLVGPLASDPAVQQAVTDRVTAAVLEHIDVQALVDQAADALAGSGVLDDPQVTERLRSLAAPLSGAIEGFVHSQVEKIVTSDAFASTWEQAVRAAHPQAIAVLTGEGSDLLGVTDGAVSVNLAPVIEKVKDALVESGFGIAAQIPQVDVSFVVFRSDGLVKAQQGFALLQKAGVVLPLLTVAALGAVIAVAPHRRRRRAALAGSLALALGMLVLGIAVSVARQLYLDALPAGVSAPAAAAVYDTVVGAFQPVLRAVLLIALLAAAVLWLVGRGPTAHRLRTAVVALRDLRRRHLSTGPVGHVLWTGRLLVRAGVLAVAGVVIVVSEPLTGRLVAGVAASAAVVLLVAEILATPPGADKTVSAPQKPPTPVSTGA